MPLFDIDIEQKPSPHVEAEGVPPAKQVHPLQAGNSKRLYSRLKFTQYLLALFELDWTCFSH